MLSLGDLSSTSGLEQLEKHLQDRTYVSGYEPSLDDLKVYVVLTKVPDGSKFPHTQRWHKQISALLKESFPGSAHGVSTSSGAASAPSAAPAAASAAAPAKAAAPVAAAAPAAVAPKEAPAKGEAAATAVAVQAAGDDDMSNSDDDEEMDLFGDLTPEEQAAADEKKRVIEEAKKRGQEKAKKTKSMIVLDVKPWDDTTDMKALEGEVRAIVQDGLLWGKSQLVPVGFGIRKMQITAIIEDAKVESMDAIIEEQIVKDGESETIQSIDIVSFNKL
ncbi:hypothetical protein WJX84_009495 [Apatococcus fuscideae]|uniref:Translation elongation factor EF1B beta/delta subunit guanine nucleotide exchange domain-containing protein n=1 Tax=Apatococcus fuscideae TaxID=2026836 RepID=A0AAW1SZ05_9CHLO